MTKVRSPLLVLALLVLVGLAPASGHEAPDAQGHWHVGDGETVTREGALTLTACTVTVEAGGRLVLRHSTLTMTCLGSARPTIRVHAGGSLVLDANEAGGSTVQSPSSTAEGYDFVVEGTLQATSALFSNPRDGLVFRPSATNSFLRLSTVRGSGETGVEIHGTRGVTIEQSRIEENPRGYGVSVHGRGAAPLIRQSTILTPGAGSMSPAAVDVSLGASVRLEGNTIEGGVLAAIRFNESRGSLMVANTVRAGGFAAVLVDQGSDVEVRNNLLRGGTSSTLQVRGSAPRIEGNTIELPDGQRIGIRLDDSAAVVRNNVVRDARIGLLATYSDDLVVEGNTFRSVEDAGILCGDGKEPLIRCGSRVLVANNTVSGAKDGIVANKLEGVVRDNVLHRSGDWGVLALNRRPALVRNSFAQSGEGAVIVAHDVRVRVLDTAGKPVAAATVSLRDATGTLPTVTGTTSADGYLRVSQGVGFTETFRLPDYRVTDGGARTDHNPYALTVSKSGHETETFAYPVVTSSPVVLRLGKKPDLVGAVDLAADSALAAGERLAFDVRVTNAGAGEAAATALTFYVDTTLVEARSLPALAPGGSRVERFAWTAAKGNHLALAVLDPENRLVEGDEANNRAELAFAVQGGTTPPNGEDPPPDGPGPDGGVRPDWAMSDVVLSKSRDLVEGDVVAVLATVTNRGDVAAPSTRVSLLDGLELVTGVPVRGLAAGESWPVSLSWRASAGLHDVALVVDHEGLVAESDEGNNRATRSVTVAERDAGPAGSGRGRDAPGPDALLLLMAAILGALAIGRTGRARR